MGCWQQAAEHGEGRRLIGIPALFRSRMAAGRGGIPHFRRRTAVQSRTHRELFAVWHGRRRSADRISVPSVRERLRQRGSATRQECQKGRGRGSEKLLPSLPTPLPSLLSLCCASDCPFFLPQQIPTQQLLLFLHHVVVPVAGVSLPPPPPPSPQLCKQTAPHSDLAPASLGRAPPDHRRRPSRRAIQRLLPLGHHQQCQDSGLVQLG